MSDSWFVQWMVEINTHLDFLVAMAKHLLTFEQPLIFYDAAIDTFTFLQKRCVEILQWFRYAQMLARLGGQNVDVENFRPAFLNFIEWGLYAEDYRDVLKDLLKNPAFVVLAEYEEMRAMVRDFFQEWQRRARLFKPKIVIPSLKNRWYIATGETNVRVQGQLKDISEILLQLKKEQENKLTFVRPLVHLNEKGEIDYMSVWRTPDTPGCKEWMFTVLKRH